MTNLIELAKLAARANETKKDKKFTLAFQQQITDLTAEYCKYMIKLYSIYKQEVEE